MTLNLIDNIIIEKFHTMAAAEFPLNAHKITGLFGSLSSGQILNCMNDEEQMKMKILEAQKLLKDAKLWKSKSSSDVGSETSKTTNDKDDKPLFFLPNAQQRYYAVEPGNKSMERLNIFRNVGRIIGMFYIFYSVHCTVYILVCSLLKVICKT